MANDIVMRDGEKATPSTTFRFMDLPPEIRNRVYSYALPGIDEKDSRRVASFRFPAITRVSRQVRKESLPLLFAETNFVFNVGTNSTFRFGAVNNGLDMASYAMRKSGTLGFKVVVQRFIKDAGNSAVFRSVTFQVHEGSDAALNRYVPDEYDEYPLHLSLTLIVEHGNVRFEVIERNCYQRLLPNCFTAETVERLGMVVEAAKQTAKEMTARKGFKGFTMKDLRRIAKEFRVSID